MLRKLVAAATVFHLAVSAFSQRNIEDIGRVLRGSAWSSGVILDNDLIFCPENNRTNLYRYNGISLSSYTYPSIAGSPLRFWGFLGREQKPIVYHSAVYFVLETAT